eukprot:8155629-Lingulodinium_polyedra.AAC.1
MHEEMQGGAWRRGRARAWRMPSLRKSSGVQACLGFLFCLMLHGLKANSPLVVPIGMAVSWLSLVHAVGG